MLLTLILAGLFTNNMVVQEGKPVNVWGSAKAGEFVEVQLAGKKDRVRAGRDGRWLAVLPAMGYGGPYTMEVWGEHDTLRCSNVMVGEVWLASGQSNMNFSVGRPVKDVEAVVAGANYPMIREFDVRQQLDKRPMTTMQTGRWEVCDTAHVRNFSAVAYFFAKALHLKKGVAVGIIHSSWSGTRIEAWIGRQALDGDTAWSGITRSIDSDTANWPAMQAKAWTAEAARTNVVAAANQGLTQGVHTLNYVDTAWKSTNYPIRAGQLGAAYYSLVWCRKGIELPAGAETMEFKLHLGKVLDADITYINGQEVGHSRGLDMTEYRIKPGVLRAGSNIVAIRLMNAWGSGIIGTPADEAWLESGDGRVRVSLSGKWRYHTAIEPALPWGDHYSNKATALYNGMIHPLAPYTIRGFLWYQGEGNAGNPDTYKKLQPTMIRAWRQLWGEGNIPFLFVQLPGLSGAGTWPAMREAQAVSLAVKATGMAVTIDAGDHFDVHPHDKAPVGERLALLAGHVAYHDSGVYTGPVLEGFVANGAIATLKFGECPTGLVLRDSAKGFVICGEDRIFYPAVAHVQGASIILSSSSVTKVVAARYAYEPDPPATLFNKEGLPAAPFRTDNL